MTTYHPEVSSLAKNIRREWPILQQDPQLATKFALPPLHAQRQPKNLRRLLTSSLNGSRQQGNKQCGKSRCQICKHMILDQTISLSQKCKIRPPPCNCDVTNAVYAIKCAKCPNALYIGETLRFRERFNNHKSSIARNLHHPVAEHFNTAGHSVNDLRCCIVRDGLVSFEDRHLFEIKMIVRNESYKKPGLNLDLSWLSNYTFFR